MHVIPHNETAAFVARYRGDGTGGRPILLHIMKGFAHWGFNDFVLCLGYRSDLLEPAHTA